MENRELTCICCPIGCQITVTLENGQVTEVCGNNCSRGEAYAKEETVRPVRVVTSTVRVHGGATPMASVKTASPIPKDKILDCMHEINAVKVNAPVKAGDVVIADVAGTGIAVVATQSVNIAQ